MSMLHFRSTERRRTARVTMHMNVLAYGETMNGEKFKFWTQTMSVSEHGGVMAVEEALQTGQEFQLMNENNRKKAKARVVGVRRGQDGKVNASFEFLSGGGGFWSMVFPATGTRPMRRFTPRHTGGEKN